MLLRLLIFIGVICAVFPCIYKFIKKLFMKYNEECNHKTMEDFANDVDVSKKKLKEQMTLEESIIKAKSNTINKVKGKVK